jgi:hypothetical protein
MDCLLKVTTGLTGEVVLPEQALECITAFWVPKGIDSMTLSVGNHTGDVVHTYEPEPGVETRLFDGVLHHKWVPVVPDFPMYAVTRQAIFLRGAADTNVWLEGVTPSPSTYINRTIVNIRVRGGTAVRHQCRPMIIEDTVRYVKDGKKLIVTHGFAYVYKAS